MTAVTTGGTVTTPAAPRLAPRRYGPTPARAAVVLLLMVFTVLWWGAWITFYVLRPVVRFLDAARHGLLDVAPVLIGALPWW